MLSGGVCPHGGLSREHVVVQSLLRRPTTGCRLRPGAGGNRFSSMLVSPAACKAATSRRNQAMATAKGLMSTL